MIWLVETQNWFVGIVGKLFSAIAFYFVIRFWNGKSCRAFSPFQSEPTKISWPFYGGTDFVFLPSATHKMPHCFWFPCWIFFKLPLSASTYNSHTNIWMCHRDLLKRLHSAAKILLKDITVYPRNRYLSPTVNIWHYFIVPLCIAEGRAVSKLSFSAGSISSDVQSQLATLLSKERP